MITTSLNEDPVAIMHRNILVIDDEAAFLLALKKLLSSDTVHILTAETLESSLQLLQSQSWDAVIADIRLTGVDRQEGLSILKEIKDHSPEVRVIMMTGFGNPDVMQSAYDLGADYYFEKPVSINVLKGALREMGILEQ